MKREPIVKKILLLLRHGETVAACRRRLIGRIDVRLSATGRRQASAASEILRSYEPERCFCSPLRRCVETGKAALRSSALKMEVDPDLREVDFGRWEKLRFEEICQRDPSAVNRWAEFDRDFTFPGGERLADFLARVRNAALRLAACPEKTILAVTHGGVIRAMLCHFLKLPPRRYVLFDVKPGSLTTLNVFDQSGVLTGFNLTS